MNPLTLLLTATTLLVITATFVVYLFQLFAMRSASRGQNILALVTFLQAPQIQGARHIVRTVLADKPLANWSTEERRLASVVCGSYDVAAILIKSKVVNPGPFVENWGPSIIHCYQILKPLVIEMRSQPHNGPKYWDDFEELAVRAQKMK